MVDIAYIVALLATLALLSKALSSHFHRRRLLLPPGPKPWPLIGNLNLIGPLPHRSIHTLSQKYGPLMQVRFGSCLVVVGSSVEMAKQFLKIHDINFASHPRTTSGKHLFYDHSNITFSPSGPYWRQARKICLTELFSSNRLESYEHIRTEEVKSVLLQLFGTAKKPFLVKDYLSSVTFNIISRMVLGTKRSIEVGASRSSVAPTPHEFREMLDEFFYLSGVMNIGDSIPWINFLDLQGYVKRMKAVSKKFDGFLEQILDNYSVKRTEKGDMEAKCMVDILMKLAGDPNLEVEFSRNHVKAFIQDILTAGTESSSMTMEWAISEILKQPSIFKHVTKELDRVIGKERWVEEKDISHLPLIEAIVKETMRKHPVAPLLIPHLCREDCKVVGYDILAGTKVLINIWTIGRDPTIWDEPEEFRPERFLGSTIDVKGQDFELLPFGSGRRMCPAYNLAVKVIQLSIANLLHGFVWNLPDKISPKELNMDEMFGLSMPRKVPLVAVVEPRLPLHLYQL